MILGSASKLLGMSKIEQKYESFQFIDDIKDEQNFKN